jgi:hypothetical protein
LIDGVAKSLAEDFFKRFETALQEKYPESVLALPPDTPEEGATADVAPQTASSGIPKWLWPLVVGGVAGLATWWFTR